MRLLASGGRILRHLVVLTLVCAVGGVFAATASAAGPVKSTYTFTATTELTGVCSFPVEVTGTVTATELDFLDETGAPVHILIHAVEQDVFSANGKSLTSLPYTYNVDVVFDSSGNVTHVYSSGLVAKLVLPDGSLFVAAGRVDFTAHPGAEFILSPDVGVAGNVEGFCAALSA